MIIGVLAFFMWHMSVYCKDKADSCTWTDHHGHNFDLSPLKRPANYQVPDTDTSMGMFNMVYEFNFCAWGVKCQNREVAAFEALEVLGKLTENCDTLGIRETQEFKLLNPSYPELGLAVTYSQGDMCFDVKEEEGLQQLMQDDQQMSMSPRSITFEITCSANNDDNFYVIDSSKCNIRLGINHSVGCSGSSSSSTTSGLLKWLIGFAVLYFGGGTIYNIKTQGKQGIEAVPNIDFWREFPMLVINGINYSLHQILGYSRNFGGSGAASNGRGYATV